MNVVKYPIHPILLVDDEPEILEGCDFMLQANGITNIITCQESTEVMSIVQQQNVEVILLDLMMPRISGKELLAQLSQSYPDIPVIVSTGMNDLETAVTWTASSNDITGSVGDFVNLTAAPFPSAF